MHFGLDSTPIDLSNLLSCIFKFLVIFFFAYPFQVLLPEGDNQVKVYFVVSGKFESTLPAITINMHFDSSVVVLVLDVNGFGFVGFVEKQGQ